MEAMRGKLALAMIPVFVFLVLGASLLSNANGQIALMLAYFAILIVLLEMMIRTLVRHHRHRH